MIDISDEDFSLDLVVRSAVKGEVGAVVSFLGVVRDDGIRALEVEAYTEAALEELARIRDEALERFEITDIDILHRRGSLKVGDNIVLIACAAPHRQAAFEACSYVIDELKSRVPLWKKEMGDGGDRWIRTR